MSNNRRKCAKCGRTRIEDMTVTYHRFPNPGIANLTKARAWAVYCWPNGDWSSKESLHSLYQTNKVLCGRHFNSSQFYDDKRQHLSKFAVPDSTEVENVLNSRENVFIEDVEPSSVTKPSKSRVPLSQIENKLIAPGVNEALASTALPTLQFTEAIAGTSKSSGIYQNLPDGQIKKSLQTVAAKAKKYVGTLKRCNISKISEMTPRENKLYIICKKRLREVVRLRNELKNKKAKNVIKTICEDECIQKFVNTKVKNSFMVLLQSQLRNAPKKPKGRRYTLKQKIMALVLYKKSPACYRLLRRMFTLPCQSSLNKLLNKVPLIPGINKHIFKSLEKMAEKHKSEENICILSFDEMSLRKHLYYDVKLDQIQGFQDHDRHGRSNQLATKALVFMLAGIRKKWKQPIAFYLSHTLNADRLTVILKEVLTECFNSKMNVVATVCDLSTVNVKVLKTLGATTSEPFFVHNEREVVAVLDPPHLLKCTRNLFMKHNVECLTDLQNNDKTVKGTAKWSHIESFYELDKNNANFVFAPALTENHLHPNAKQKMRVKLAAQVFSHSVTAGILAKIASNELPSEAHATAVFLQKFDELFDALNSDSPDLRGGKKYSTNITSKSPHFGFFVEMKKFVTSMTYMGTKSSPPSQDGWIQTINAVERLSKKLWSLNVKTLSTRRLNQDPLENCFGCIRYNCGSNNNPTIPQFIAGIKTAIITNLRHSGQKKNCEDDNAIISNNLTTFLTGNIDSKYIENSEINIENVIFNEEEFENIFADTVEAIDQATPESQACGYVCGFIFKRLRNKNCPECRNAFLNEFIEPIHLFTSLKEYDANSNSLIYVNKNIIQCVEMMATIINKYLITDAWQVKLKVNIMPILNTQNFSFLEKCMKHFDINATHLKNSTFCICIKRYITLKNRELDEEERNKALERKIKILRNK